MLSQSGHYYDINGLAVWEVPNKTKGGMRKTTLADCKKLGLLPSVTTYFKTLAKPELEQWKMRQVAMAALTFPHQPGEDDVAFIDRVIVDAFEQVDDAADLGTQIHLALEQHFQGQFYDVAMETYVKAVDELVKKEGITFSKHELRLVSLEWGYAGTTDALGMKDGKKCLLDFKSRKTKAGMKCSPWSTEPIQIAAYARIAKCEIGGNIYISTTEPGRVEVVYYDAETLKKAWDAFTHIIHLWHYQNGYVPKSFAQRMGVVVEGGITAQAF